MKPASVVAGVVMLGGAIAATIFWPERPRSALPEDVRTAAGAGERTTGSTTLGTGAAGSTGAAETGGSPANMVGSTDRNAAGQPPREPRQAAVGQASAAGAASATGPARIGPAGRRAASAPAPGGTPRVSVPLAFKALLYVGVDPEAEKTWMQAINDPNMPEGVRSDLIEDLNDEGYRDPSGNHITKEDLPLILARLEIIERLAPYAKDKVNAEAFQEAYKDLLNMYVRLGGVR